MRCREMLQHQHMHAVCNDRIRTVSRALSFNVFQLVPFWSQYRFLHLYEVQCNTSIHVHSVNQSEQFINRSRASISLFLELAAYHLLSSLYCTGYRTWPNSHASVLQKPGLTLVSNCASGLVTQTPLIPSTSNFPIVVTISNSC